ncbi:MAG TPA: hypothetical protein DCO83_02140 [Mucilaginibacter sp.]|nr:hypothetical protein [Mucilaginibacter sp.]
MPLCSLRKGWHAKSIFLLSTNISHLKALFLMVLLDSLQHCRGSLWNDIRIEIFFAFALRLNVKTFMF